jgi:hypothetical protein
MAGVKVHETVDPQHLVAAPKKGFGDPGTYKTRATCDEYSQKSIIFAK